MEIDWTALGAAAAATATALGAGVWKATSAILRFSREERAAERLAATTVAEKSSAAISALGVDLVEAIHSHERGDLERHQAVLEHVTETGARTRHATREIVQEILARKYLDGRGEDPPR